MTTFTIPNEADAVLADGDQAEPDARDFQALVEGFALTGVVSGCEVTAQGTPDMTVHISAGTVVIDGVASDIAADDVSIDAAHATLNRYDIVATDGASVVVWAGTAAANPVFPDWSGDVVLAAVLVLSQADPDYSGAIDPGAIISKRVVVNPWTVGGTMTGLLKLPTMYADSDEAYATGSMLPATIRAHRSAANITDIQAVIFARAEMHGTVNVANRVQGISSYMADAASVVNKTITAMSRVGTTVTVTAAGHTLTAGERIAIYGVTHTFDQEVNGAWTVANPTADTFDITVPSLSSGAYTSGGTVTNRPMYYAFAAAVYPSVARGGLTGTAQYADDVAAYIAYNGGTAKGTDAYYLGHNAAISGSEWITGFSIDAFADYGIRLNGTFTAVGLDLYGTFPVGIQLGGTFSAYGIDFNAGSFTAGQIRLKNNALGVMGRNAAGSGNVELFRINTLDEMQIFPTCRYSGDFILADTKNLIFSATTGSKIGTASTQKIGFWNHAPVAQPAAYTISGNSADRAYTKETYSPTNVSADTAFDANATTINELADVLGTLCTKFNELQDFAMTLASDLQGMGLVG